MSLIGQAYHVNFATVNREPLLGDFWCSRRVIGALRASDVSQLSHTHALVVMPDHVHWLFSLRGGTLSDVVARAKADAARRINTALRGSLWQKDFFDHALRSDEALIGVARYIVANPLRAGIATNVSDYSHWYAEWL